MTDFPKSERPESADEQSGSESLWQELFRGLGNSKFAWFQSAGTLWQAAELIEQHAIGLEPAGNFMIGLRRPEAMLKGLAIECLLKGLWVRDGNQFVVGGALRVDPHIPTGHGLVAWAAKAKVDLSAAERYMLQQLTGIVTFAGRYPIALSYDKWRTGAGSGVSDPWYFSQADFEVATTLFERLVAQADYPVRLTTT